MGAELGNGFSKDVVKCGHLEWWMRSNESKEYILEHGSNPKYVESIRFPKDKLNISTDLQEIIDASDIIIVAIPNVPRASNRKAST